jgi:hypothetical protein
VDVITQICYTVTIAGSLYAKTVRIAAASAKDMTWEKQTADSDGGHEIMLSKGGNLNLFTD